MPLPGPQTAAFESQADVLLYGGAAGGGKTDLAIGLALTEHARSIIFRREAPQVQGILDRMAEVLGTWDGYSSKASLWRIPGRQVEFGSCPHLGDETKYQGRPHDLKVFDEIPLFLERQFRFLAGWLRSSDPGQRKRIVCTGNPPTDEVGAWVIKYWAPWLDEHHPNPAKPGELRWFAVIDGKDIEVANGDPFEHGDETIQPQSRTFIPSKVQDNPFLMTTGYEAQLQALPEPLRSQMLRGDFLAGREDSQWQVIPTEWVRAAQTRWKPRDSKGPMDSVGVDVARGGKDKTVISRRHGFWYDELIAYPGKETPDGPTTAGLAIAAARNGAPMHVDVIGVGASVADFLEQAGVQVIPVNVAEGTDEADRTGQLRFANLRALLIWKFREMLDPANDYGAALPPDDELRSDLCAPRWKLRGGKVLIESKEEIFTRIGRSTDKGDAVVLASIETPKALGSKLVYPKLNYV